MDISIASARGSTQQANTVRSKVPMHLRQGAENFIGFLEDYYKYLNTDGLPSQEINNIVSEQDIDRTSAQYIDQIQKEIAKNIPDAVAFDRVSLYKKIVNYYLTKGSEDSIINFFKIFYNETISITYPRDRLFKSSSGLWDEGNNKYLNTKGFTSDADVLQDSHFWQDFSYAIETTLPVKDWKNEFLGLVHPAGFKFFGVLVLLIIRRRNWIGRFIKYNEAERKYEYDNLPDNYRTPHHTYDPSIDIDWMKSLTPPSSSSEDGYGDQYGEHMPMFQFGILGQFIIHNICAIANADDETFDRFIIMTIHHWSISGCDHYSTTRNDYLKNLKFLDTDSISEHSDTLIKYGDTYSCHDIEAPLVDFLNVNVPLDQTPVDYECIVSNNDLEIVNEKGDCLNIAITYEYDTLTDHVGDELVDEDGDFISGITQFDGEGVTYKTFDANRELDPQVSESLGQTGSMIPIINKMRKDSLMVVLNSGNLYGNYMNRRLFSNISSFIDTDRDTILVAEDTTSDTTVYHNDAIVTGDGDNLRLFFDYGEQLRKLLEIYTGAKAAYSLRSLSTEWDSQPVVEVRRSDDGGGDSEKSFTASEVASGALLVWVTEHNATADGFVSIWYDQSGNVNNAVQTNTANQPKIVENGEQLTDGVTFDGIDDMMVCPSLYSSSMSIFNVSKVYQTANVNSYMRMLYLSDGVNSFQITREGGGSSEPFYLHSKNTAFQTTLGTFRYDNVENEAIVTAITSNTDTDAYIDGALSSKTTIDALGSGNRTTTLIGARDDLGSSTFFEGAMREIIIYDSDQSSNRTGIETNINNYYDIIDAPSEYLRLDGSLYIRPDERSHYLRPLGQ